MNSTLFFASGAACFLRKAKKKRGGVCFTAGKKKQRRFSHQEKKKKNPRPFYFLLGSVRRAIFFSGNFSPVAAFDNTNSVFFDTSGHLFRGVLSCCPTHSRRESILWHKAFFFFRFKTSCHFPPPEDEAGLKTREKREKTHGVLSCCPTHSRRESTLWHKVFFFSFQNVSPFSSACGRTRPQNARKGRENMHTMSKRLSTPRSQRFENTYTETLRPQK